MKSKVLLIGAAGALGAYGLYKKINNHLDKRRRKRDYEIRNNEEKWFMDGWKGGYNAGKQDAVYDSFRNKPLSNDED